MSCAAAICTLAELSDLALAAVETATNHTDALNTMWLIVCGALVFFMQCGFAMLCAGSVRSKNVSNIMLKNLLDACGGAIGFWSVGYAFAYGDRLDADGTPIDGVTFIGGRKDYFLMDEGVNYALWFFQFAFAATAATIVAGAIAERCKMAAYLCYSTMLTGVVYPVVVHAIWSSNGFLSAFNSAGPLFKDTGMIDFAGSGVVHLTGGFSALIAAIILGPRIGRFTDKEGNPAVNTMQSHNVSLQILGTFILWVGWYGFNPGSTLLMDSTNAANVAGLCTVTTTISASAGACSALFLRYFFGSTDGIKFFDLTAAMNGALSGLVGITAGCSVIYPSVSLVVGIISGAVYLGASNLLIKFKIDDVVDAVPVHMANGIWGCMAVGLFAAPDLVAEAYGRDTGPVGWMYEWGRSSGDFRLMATQLCGVLFILGWVGCMMGPYFMLLQWLGWFRVHEVDEEIGMDLSHHGASTYSFEKPAALTVDMYEQRKAKKISKRSKSSAVGEPEVDTV
ncbi:hypothetical protein ScalyP_jg1051 [Parmales sp. scaly parma]|nr:hypothetical protein ScalyP_jg1051 [Parmales sp. scaly parma]